MISFRIGTFTLIWLFCSLVAPNLLITSKLNRNVIEQAIKQLQLHQDGVLVNRKFFVENDDFCTFLRKTRHLINMLQCGSLLCAPIRLILFDMNRKQDPSEDVLESIKRMSTKMCPENPNGLTEEFTFGIGDVVDICLFICKCCTHGGLELMNFGIKGMVNGIKHQTADLAGLLLGDKGKDAVRGTDSSLIDNCISGCVDGVKNCITFCADSMGAICSGTTAFIGKGILQVKRALTGEDKVPVFRITTTQRPITTTSKDPDFLSSNERRKDMTKKPKKTSGFDFGDEDDVKIDNDESWEEVYRMSKEVEDKKSKNKIKKNESNENTETEVSKVKLDKDKSWEELWNSSNEKNTTKKTNENSTVRRDKEDTENTDKGNTESKKTKIDTDKSWDELFNDSKEKPIKSAS